MTTSNSTPESPLTEADSSSLDELFSADPLSLTKAERAKMIEAFRSARVLWAKADDEAAKKGKGARTKKADAMTDLSQLKIDL